MFRIISLLAFIGAALVVSAWEVEPPYCTPSSETHFYTSNATASDCAYLLDYLRRNVSDYGGGGADGIWAAGTWRGESLTHWKTCRFVANTLPAPNITETMMAGQDIAADIYEIIGDRRDEGFVGGYGKQICGLDRDRSGMPKTRKGPLWWALVGMNDTIPDFIRHQSVPVQDVQRRDVQAQKLCDPSFQWQDQTSSNSPLVNDCRALVDQVRGSDTVYTFMSTQQTTLAKHGSCLFAAGTEGLPGGIKMSMGGEDIATDIMEMIVDGDGNVRGGNVGGWGKQLCPQYGDKSNGPKDQVKWFIFNSKDAPKFTSDQVLIA
ncbi:putative necrosis-inducing factor-domain-containing protein [Cladorrhinum sp. PSN259]|nr:putative necrosis-inducing factor-domain-containing protein [Cladorrhinum sp. PSN259]